MEENIVYEYVASSVKGNGRDKNEDRIMVNNTVISDGSISGVKKDNFIAVVCDGVGGTNGGEIAAEMVASGFVGYEVEKASAYLLNHHIQNINTSVMNAQKQLSKYKNMASTAAGIMFWKNRFLLFNLGDTRIYEAKDNSVLLKTKDHTLGTSKAEVSHGIRQDALTRYIGGFGHACNPSIVRGCISGTERYFLVCSDGIHKKIPDEVLGDILSERSSLEDKKRAILNLSIQNGSTDDKSLVLVRYAA